jgi:glycosyltransferase involved in cell wall biosynthesis
LGELPRVLAVIRWPVGGIRTWCKYIYRNPEFANFAIDIVMPRGHEATALVEDMRRGGVVSRVIEVESSTAAMAARVAALVAGGRYSLVHSHGFTSAAIAVLPCRLRRVPHLVTVHDVVLDHQYRDWRGRLIRRSMDTALRHVDCIHAVSQSCREHLLAAFPSASRCSRGIRVILNGIEPAGFLAARPKEIRAGLGLPQDAILVGFFGRFMSQKGFTYLVDAVRKAVERGRSVPPIAVLAVGGGGYRREEEQRVASLGLTSHFFFMDFTADVASVMKAVDVVAMPSLWEACPILPMEALTAGVPLVTSDFPALEEVVAGSPARTTPMKDSDALLQAILEMGTPAQRDIAEAFAPLAARRHDAADARRAVSAMYAYLMTRPRPGRAGTRST